MLLTSGTLEQKKTPYKAPEFSVYFHKHIEDDMRDGMLLHVRRSAGLGDKFFYNNGEECCNFKNKSNTRLTLGPSLSPAKTLHQQTSERT